MKRKNISVDDITEAILEKYRQLGYSDSATIRRAVKALEAQEIIDGRTD